MRVRLPGLLLRLKRPQQPPPRGFVRFGSLRRTEPVSRKFGFDRGQGIDRYYIARFLKRHATDLRGSVLEVGDDQYSRTIGGWGGGGQTAIDSVDILHVTGENIQTTIVADLTIGEGLEDESFDCVICVQTLQFIYELTPAVATLHRILRPGGTLLATGTGISQISRYDMDRWGDYWRFTSLSFGRLLGESFGETNVEVSAHGNVLAATAFLHGLSREELSSEELDHPDPDYEVILTARGVKVS